MIYIILWSIVGVAFIFFAARLWKSLNQDSEDEENTCIMSEEDIEKIRTLKLKVRLNYANVQYGHISDYEYQENLNQYWQELFEIERKYGLTYDK